MTHTPRQPNETIEQYVTRLEATVAAAKQPTSGRISFKVSEKGALSVYGFQRFPITFYKETWAKLAETMPEILAFAKANDALLKSKDDAAKAPATPPTPPVIAPRGEVLSPSAPLPEVQQLLQ